MLYELQTLMVPILNASLQLPMPKGWEALSRIPWRGQSKWSSGQAPARHPPGARARFLIPFALAPLHACGLAHAGLRTCSEASEASEASGIIGWAAALTGK